MKYLLFVLLFASSCTMTPKYIPHHSKLKASVHGGQVTLKTKNMKYKGELIALDSTQVYVLLDRKSTCLAIDKSLIKSYTIKYADVSKSHELTPLFNLFSFTHGIGGVITLPMNLITTTLIMDNAKKEFMYSNKNLQYQNLKKFARFPHGLPPNVTLADLEPNK